MSAVANRGLFAHVESYFSDYLARQRGASVHTVRAYRDALALLLKFVAKRRCCGMASLQLMDLDAEAVMLFLDHIETDRSNSAATRNCRRAAIRSFFKHLLRNDLAHSQQYIRVLAIPAKKARQRPATYLEPEDARLIVGTPDKRTPDGWRDYTLLLFLYNCGARVSEAAGLRWDDLQLTAPRQVRLRGKGRKERLLPLWRETANALHRWRRWPPLAVRNVCSSTVTVSRSHVTGSHTCCASTQRRLPRSSPSCNTSASRPTYCATAALSPCCSPARMSR
jgi:integrase/recombinase XerD